MTQRTLAVLTMSGLMMSLFVACGTDGDATSISEEDVSSIEARLEQDNGGFDLQDESLFFDPSDLHLPFDFDYARDTIENAHQIMNELGELPTGIEQESLTPPASGDSGDESVPDPSIGKNMGDPNVIARPLPPCAKLLMLGKWKAVKEGFGVFRGVVVVPTPMLENKKGVVVGFVKGIWGKGRFIGKAVRRNGKGWALVKGLYGKGHFKGRLRTRAGIRGVLHGKYGPAGRFAGAMKLLCPADCQKLCPGDFNVMPEGGCVCRPNPCPDGLVLDICPKLLEVCVTVTPLPSSDSDPSATPQKSHCKVTCAPPICRKPMPKCCKPCPGGQNCPSVCIPAPCAATGTDDNAATPSEAPLS